MKRSDAHSRGPGRVSLAAALATAATIVAPLAAFADGHSDDLTRADDLLATVEEVAPEVGVEAVELRQARDEIVADSEATSVSIPNDADGEIVIESEDAERSLTVQLPREVDADDVEVSAQGDIALYTAAEVGDAAMTVEAFEDGAVRVQTVMAGPESPHKFSYGISVPVGGRIEVAADGSAAVLDGTGEWVAGAGVPWAYDAAGRSVATHYEVDGSELVQVVETTEQTQYPVTADPVLGIWLVSKVVRDTSPSQGTTYRVTPTINGRGATAVWYGVLWSDAKAKGLPNVGKYKDQLICHPMSQVARVKSTWNIDSWRPDVGLAKTVLAKCNP